MKINKKYMLIATNFASDIGTFNKAFLNTPNISIKKINSNTGSLEEVDNLIKLSDIYKDGTPIRNYVFVRKFNKKEYLSYAEFSLWDFDKIFGDNLLKLVLDAHENADKLATEGFSGERETGGVEALVMSLVMKWSYSDECSILSMTADLLFDITNAHRFSNGNKRTALITAVNFLQLCGLFLERTSKNPENYVNNWESFMVKVSDKSMSEFEAKEYIINYLSDKLRINYTVHNI